MKLKQISNRVREEFFEYLAKAKNILIITHREMDHDAITSALLTRHTLTTYYKKKATIIIQDHAAPTFAKLDLPGIESIKNVSNQDTVQTEAFDLVLMVDAGDLDRCISPSEERSVFLRKTISIDHHITDAKEEPMMTINEKRSSAAEQVYALFRSDLKELHTDKTAAKLTQIGILADSDRFMFSASINSETFTIFGELFEEYPIDIEQVYYRLIKNTRNSLFVFDHLLNNAEFDGDMVYSFVDPEFIKKNNYSFQDEESARSMFLQFYARTIDDINWGFILRKSANSDQWKVSFRAVTGTREVRTIAEKLGGGGHLYAAGATFDAKDATDAVKKVLKAAA